MLDTIIENKIEGSGNQTNLKKSIEQKANELKNSSTPQSKTKQKSKETP